MPTHHLPVLWQALWAGCGAHVEQVLGDVPADDRCACGADGGAGSSGGPGWLRRLLGG